MHKEHFVDVDTKEAGVLYKLILCLEPSSSNISLVGHNECDRRPEMLD